MKVGRNQEEYSGSGRIFHVVGAANTKER